MKKTILGLVLGATALAASTAALAHMDVAVGVGVPGAAYAPVPVQTDWRGDDDWRARRWREHEWREHERREHEWRERQWREREWHDRGRWDY
ncbi:hypothetical protein [Paraburkholderia heleia]|uniref:hypothetical protein n=1 Tax=Paraburkholderia heleia TaxID=634127 RepID=UPI0005AB875B|nr:hypothetical protein [Paraburkholderia heleia]